MATWLLGHFAEGRGLQARRIELVLQQCRHRGPSRFLPLGICRCTKGCFRASFSSKVTPNPGPEGGVALPRVKSARP